MSKVKLKTKKTAVKRFKVSGTGKIMRRKASNSHMFFHKSPGRKRRLDQPAELFAGEYKRVKRLLAI